MNTMILLVFAACMPTTYYPEGGSAPAYATVERVEVYKSKEELFKKTGSYMYFSADVVVLKDGVISEQMPHYDFVQQMEKERLVKTKPAMPKFFDCTAKWKCKGNEKESVCVCKTKTESLQVEVANGEECANKECRRPWSTVSELSATNTFVSTGNFIGAQK